MNTFCLNHIIYLHIYIPQPRICPLYNMMIFLRSQKKCLQKQEKKEKITRPKNYSTILSKSKIFTKCTKFFGTLTTIYFYRPRIKYLTHVANLQFYIRKGLVLKKIHTLIKFKQEDFAATFIKMTTRLRKNAITDFDKSFWKFINNVLFGKSMEGKSTKFLA